MSTRAYVIIDSAEGKAQKVLTALQGKPEITSVNYVEGALDIIVTAEAENNRILAKLTVQALLSIENLTNDTQILPVCDDFSNVRNI